MSNLDIGFIGLGIMGKPMAGHLLDAGHRVTTSTHHKAAPAELLKAGLGSVGTPREVASSNEVIILMVPDTPQVEEVLFGPDGVGESRLDGKVVIDMSSIAPMATKTFAERVRALGGDYVDAPVSGGEVGAKNAALSIMVGAAEATFERIKPILEIMGKNIIRIGEVGDGQTCKVANQIAVALTIQAVAESLTFASKAGADVAKVREALLGGLATSRILEIHGERMIKRTFEPGFRIELHQKDLNLALSGARELGVALPNTAIAQEMFNACRAAGGQGWDHSGLVRAIEMLSNHEIGQK
ncbi:2-hydroxy-3-oxopropionate reductase [Halomonas sp. ML-15]|uniref:2-hydroxy-3-oxopropionate reductase n=1 Tax=Halomonas sp. ML-15 TaxID=2773305 RepID=UPI00174709FE|nr:2-hydroxy-3-oxopropionate reductase [Halomonas sp. ML-15]MBD3896362.1 2-hydroxy-3-oxopropionate reductase [Halomonas sp. ML-15]